MYYENKQVSSDTEPLRVEITPTAVFTRTDVQERNDTLGDGKERKYYVYKESKLPVPKHIEDLTKENGILGESLMQERFKLMQQTAMTEALGGTVTQLRLEVLALKGGDA